MYIRGNNMPVERCQRDNEKGWRWGKRGKCYLPSEEGSEEAAKEKAARQGRAIKRQQDAIATESIQKAFPQLIKGTSR
jgi:hypothetical protein